MIAPLRSRHRWLTGLLAIAVPVLYVLAISARTEMPRGALPAALTEDAAAAGESLIDGELFEKHPAMVQVLRGTAGWSIEVAPREAIIKPEVLVYWAPRIPVAEQVPEGAYLLGGLAGTRSRVFALPDAILGREGQLVLYSLGHQEVLDLALIPVIGAPAGPADAVVDEAPATEESGS